VTQSFTIGAGASRMVIVEVLVPADARLSEQKHTTPIARPVA